MYHEDENGGLVFARAPDTPQRWRPPAALRRQAERAAAEQRATEREEARRVELSRLNPLAHGIKMGLRSILEQ